MQGKAPIASRGHRRVPYSVLSSDNDRRPVLVQQPVPQYSRPSRDVLSRPLISFMAVPLGPPRRSALADWDKAEKDETTLETGKQTRPVMLSVAVQVEDELGDTGDRVDASHTATLSERRSQLSKRVRLNVLEICCLINRKVTFRFFHLSTLTLRRLIPFQNRVALPSVLLSLSNRRYNL